jgi:large subunit ribosomal protein L13
MTKQAKTTVLKPAEVKREWIVIDASEAPLGRIATLIATRLMGKHRANYTPHVDSGDYVIVVNAAQTVVTGRKEQQKIYYHHTQFPGGIKETNLSDLRSKKPEFIIESAVKGMLPKNKLQKLRMARLKVYAGAEHEHMAQKPQKIGVK